MCGGFCVSEENCLKTSVLLAPISERQRSGEARAQDGERAIHTSASKKSLL
jgi:hypothetical protein